MMTLPAGNPTMRRVRPVDHLHMRGIGGSGMAGIARKEATLINLGTGDRGIEPPTGLGAASIGAST